MPNPNTNTPQEVVQQAVREIIALRKLTKQTGTISTRAQNTILQKLAPDALTKVALILEQLEEAGQ